MTPTCSLGIHWGINCAIHTWAQDLAQECWHVKDQLRFNLTASALEVSLGLFGSGLSSFRALSQPQPCEIIIPLNY